MKGTDTMRFTKKEQVPLNRRKDVTYGSFSCDIKPNKEEKEGTRLTAVGDCINYPDDVGTLTADVTLFKCMVNSIISTPGAHFIMVDIKDFYLNTLMTRFEYMQIKISNIPEKIIEEYNLREIVTKDRYIYCKIRKGMYGLPQAGIIAQELLTERLAKHGYHQSKIIPGLWMHETRPTTFTLVMDDFAIKIMSKNNADHVINVLKKNYTITVDREGTKYIGLTIEWDYENGKVHMHMQGYLAKAMTRFKHETPTKIQHSLHHHIEVNYKANKQYVSNEEESPPPHQRRDKIHTGGSRHPPILRKSSRFHHPPST